MTFANEPDSFDGIDAEAGYQFDRDSGTFSGPEQVDTFMDIDYEPGEIWEFRFAVSVSSEPGDPTVLEVFDADGDYLFNKTIDGFSGTYFELQATAPAYELNGDFSAPASDNGSADLSFQISGSDSGNYWATVEALRLRSPIDRTGRYQGNVDSFDGGFL